MDLLNKMLHNKVQNYRVILFINFIASRMKLFKYCSLFKLTSSKSNLRYLPALLGGRQVMQHGERKLSFVQLLSLRAIPAVSLHTFQSQQIGPTCTFSSGVDEELKRLNNFTSGKRSPLLVRNTFALHEVGAKKRFNDALEQKGLTCCVRIGTQTPPNVHLTAEEIQKATLLMPSSEAPALDRFPLKFINFSD